MSQGSPLSGLSQKEHLEFQANVLIDESDLSFTGKMRRINKRYAIGMLNMDATKEFVKWAEKVCTMDEQLETMPALN